MKLLFGCLHHQEPVSVNIDANMTLDQVAKKLNAEHKFGEGLYTFFYNGRVLQNLHPLDGIAEGSIIIVNIKKEIAKQSRVPKLETAIRNFFETAQIGEAYNPDFYYLRNPAQVQAVSNAFRNNSSHMVSLSYHDIMHQSMVGAIQSSIFDHTCIILDIDRIGLILEEDEFDALADELPKIHRDLYEEIVKSGIDKQSAFTIAKECDFDRNRAFELLGLDQ